MISYESCISYWTNIMESIPEITAVKFAKATGDRLDITLTYFSGKEESFMSVKLEGIPDVVAVGGMLLKVRAASL